VRGAVAQGLAAEGEPAGGAQAAGTGLQPLAEEDRAGLGPFEDEAGTAGGGTDAGLAGLVAAQEPAATAPQVTAATAHVTRRTGPSPERS